MERTSRLCSAQLIADEDKNGVDDREECVDPRYCVGDGLPDDLRITFTEAGIGNSKMVDIEVTASRRVEVTCVSGLGEFVIAETLPVTISFGEADSAAMQFTHEDNGRLLTGAVTLRTNFHDDGYTEETDPPHEAPVCPRYDPRGLGILVEFNLAKDYSITYSDVTVTDHENGGASASKVLDESYHHHLYGGFTMDAGLLGLSCTVEDLESGHCGTS